jgi:hypothetical protein
LLREEDKMMFSKGFYYAAIIINFGFRFWWLFAVFIGVDESNL